MTVFNRVFTKYRRFVARLVLKGWIMDLWLGRKMRRLESRYLGGLVRGSLGKPSVDMIPVLRKGGPLRRILVISDAQWEQKELIPELEKICPVTFFNLHPVLENRVSSGGLSKVVRDSIDEFIRENTSLETDLL